MSNPTLTERMDAAIQNTRCGDYWDDDHCVGLDGCDRCLALARDAVLRVIGEATDEETIEAAAVAIAKASISWDWDRGCPHDEQLKAELIESSRPLVRAAASLLLAPVLAAYESQVEHTNVVRSEYQAMLRQADQQLATLRQRLAEAAWQPIATAPKDKAVLVYHAGCTIAHLSTAHGCWLGRGLDTSDTRALAQFAPTHWMPLPVPPPGTAEEAR